MDWGSFRFQDPAWLWLAALAPLVLVAAWLRERDRAARAVSFPGAARLARVRPGLRVRLRHAPLVLGALALTTSAVALARPQHGSLREDVTTQGVDIVVALDVSSSRSEPCWGRASATAEAASARAPSTSGAWRNLTRRPGRTRCRRAAPGNETARAARSRSRSHAATSTSGGRTAAQSHAGSWKRRLPQSIKRPCLPLRRQRAASASLRVRGRARGPTRGAARPRARGPVPWRT